MEDAYIQKIIENEQRSKSNTHRIDEIETEQRSQRELIISVKELATEVKHMREEVNVVKEEQKSDRESINSRLKSIEDKPAKRYEQVVSLIITRYSNSYIRFFYSKIRNVRRVIIMWVKKVQELTLRRYGSLFEDAFGMLPITQYGAIGDNVTDNYGELQVVIDKSIENGYKYIFVPKGEYYYYGKLENVDKVIFVGNSMKAKIYNQNGEKIKIEQIGLSTVANLAFVRGEFEIKDKQITFGYNNFSLSVSEDIIISEIYLKVGINNNIVYAANTLNLCDGKIITADNCPVLYKVKTSSENEEDKYGYVYLTGIRTENNLVRIYYETVGLTEENMPTINLKIEYWLRGNGKYKIDDGLQPPEPIPPLFDTDDPGHNTPLPNPNESDGNGGDNSELPAG